jgi:hypothetical protein
MKVYVELRKKIVGEKRFDLLNHFPIRVLGGFEQWKKNFYLLIKQVCFNTVFIAGLGLDHKPES